MLRASGAKQRHVVSGTFCGVSEISRNRYTEKKPLQVLFVTCHDKEPLEEMKGYVGQLLSIQTTAAGNVTWNLAEPTQLSSNGGSSSPSSAPSLKMAIPKWCACMHASLARGVMCMHSMQHV